MLARLATVVEGLLAGAIAWPVLRLSLGRWPTHVETSRFRQAFCDRPARMPAMLRGLGSIPTIRNHFIDLLAPPASTMPPLLFLHIEKTAGTSVVEYLCAQFDAHDVDDDPFHGAPGHLLCPVPDDKRRYALIWGHQDLPSLLRCQPPRRFVVTILREPRQRILSLYAYWRALRPEEITGFDQHEGVLAARSRDLLAFLESPEPGVLDFIDNVYARRLTGCYASHGAEPNPAEWQESALRALGSFDFLGIVEELGLSLQALAALTGAPPPSIVPRRNVLQTMQLDPEGQFTTTPRLSPGPRERACLDRLTSIDRPIYAAALAGFRGMTATLDKRTTGK